MLEDLDNGAEGQVQVKTSIPHLGVSAHVNLQSVGLKEALILGIMASPMVADLREEVSI